MPSQSTRLVEAVRGRHGSLDDKAANVLPALLEKRDEVVDGKHDVGDELLLLHLDVADGDTHAENLLELELDGGLDLGDLAAQVVGVRDGGRELASCGGESAYAILFKPPRLMGPGEIQYAYPWTDRDPGDGGSA